MAPRARIILLNGVGSVGKTSVARALQEIASSPFLHVQMDAFLDMLPAASFGTPDGLSFTHGEEGGRPSAAITSGPVAGRLFRGMRRAIAAMAAEGSDLIVDDVLGDGDAEDYRRLLQPFDLKLVGLFASLEVLEAREAARGDRMVGLAYGQFDRVHRNIAYDLWVDTTHSTPAESAAQIAAAFGL
jgi:chloramphenicol 3-O phosphotransferase